MIRIYIIIAVTLWASGFVSIRASLLGYSPIDTAMLRYLVASLLLLLIAFYKKIKFPEKKTGPVLPCWALHGL